MAVHPYDFTTPLPLTSATIALADRLAGAIPDVGIALTTMCGRPITTFAGAPVRRLRHELDAALVPIALADGDKVCWLLLSDTLLRRFADLFMGGRGSLEDDHPSTPMERDLAARRLASCARSLHTAMTGVLGDWVPRVGEDLTSALPGEVAVVACPVTMQDAAEDEFLLAMRLVAPVGTTSTGPRAGLDALAGVPVPIQALLGHAVVNAADMAALDRGDVLTLAHATDEPVVVQVDGHALMRANLATHRGRLALVVAELTTEATA